MIKTTVLNLFFVFSLKDSITYWNGELLEGNAFLHLAAGECIPHFEGALYFMAHLQNVFFLFPFGLVPT